MSFPGPGGRSAPSHTNGLRRERGDSPKENWGDFSRRRGSGARQLKTADAITRGQSMH